MLLGRQYRAIFLLVLSAGSASALPVCSGSGIETAINFDQEESNPCPSTWASCIINPVTASAWMLPNNVLKEPSSFDKDPSGKKIAANLLQFIDGDGLKERAPDFKLCEPRLYGTVITIGNIDSQAKKCVLDGDFTAKFTNPKGRRVTYFSSRVSFPMWPSFTLNFLEADGSKREFSHNSSGFDLNYLIIDRKTCKSKGYLPISITRYLYIPLYERSLGPVPYSMLVKTFLSVTPTNKAKPKQEFRGL